MNYEAGYVWQTYKDMWITRDYQKFYPSEMTTKHIENCLKLMDHCCHHNKIDKRTVPIYRKLRMELNRRKRQNEG